MGFFSWNTQDTNKSIANAHSSKDTFQVTMTDNKGNKFTEDNYDGYGIFGGKDYYELLAEMNGKVGRDEGITLAFGKKAFIAPNLNEDPSAEWENTTPEDCEFQGFFYYDEDEDEDDDWGNEDDDGW